MNVLDDERRVFPLINDFPSPNNIARVGAVFGEFVNVLENRAAGEKADAIRVFDRRRELDNVLWINHRLAGLPVDVAGVLWDVLAIGAVCVLGDKFKRWLPIAVMMVHTGLGWRMEKDVCVQAVVPNPALTAPKDRRNLLDFTFELVFHLREAGYIQSVKYMCAVGWIPSEDKNIVSPRSSSANVHQRNVGISTYEQLMLAWRSISEDREAVAKIAFIDEGKKSLNIVSTRGATSKLLGERPLNSSSQPRRNDSLSIIVTRILLPLYRCACIMEGFDPPTLDELHLIPGLCNEIALGVERMAGFPSLHTLPLTALLGHHGVNNTYEDRKTQDLARGMVNERLFMNWPFFHQGLVVALSDLMFKYEMFVVTPGSPVKVISTPHGSYHRKSKAERIEGSSSLPRRQKSINSKDVVVHRKASRYYLSFKAAEMKNNLGLSLKYEAKALKVIDYSRKEGRNWDYSEKAIELPREYKSKFPTVFRCLDGNGDGVMKAVDALPGPDPAGKSRVGSNPKVSEISRPCLFAVVVDQVLARSFKETVAEIEALADTITKSKSPESIKKAIAKSIPRQAVLKPSHVAYRLQNQCFAPGDRVTMVQDSGGVPLSVKGVVEIGPCSQYRGSTVGFNTCLNVTDPHTSTNPKAPRPVHNNALFKPRLGQHPAITPAPGQAAAPDFRPARPVNPNQPSHVHIMVNPNRGGWRRSYVNGRGGPPPKCQRRMSRLIRLAQQECRLRRLSALVTLVVEEGLHEEGEVLFQDFVVVVGSFQGVIEVEGYREEVSAAEVEGLSLLFLLHREVDVYQTDY
ncbi:hypothetical protein BYT27DRAFT_7258489 [Phlegmacium glaucopus]|nr:hypothetical protein BYT27DRAFT_7258489 [Phlegmacium glaucopus]